MNIAKGAAAAISLQSLSKKIEGKGKNGAFLGKVIAKSGKEIQVLINDKVYKIEPGNAQKIKIGDSIQVFFGRSLPQEISEEVLKKISGKLIDVFSLSLPYQTTRELEDLINQMPQNERLQFAKISNEIIYIVESILKEEYLMELEKSSSAVKNSSNLFNPNLPYNRRLIELSLKAKEMGKGWEHIPDNIKKEIVKKYVLFDLPKQNKNDQNHPLEAKPKTLYFGENVEEKKSKLSINNQESFEKMQKALLIDNESQKPDNIKIKNKESLNNIKQEENVSKMIAKKIVEQTEKHTNFSSEKENLEHHKTKKTDDLITTKNGKNKHSGSIFTIPANQKKQVEDQLIQRKNQEMLDTKLQSNLKDSSVKKLNNEQVKNIQSQKENFTALTPLKDRIENKNNLSSFYPREEIKMVIRLLENSISKPLSIEKNLENLKQLPYLKFHDNSRSQINEKTEKQITTDQQSLEILQLIKKISSTDSNITDLKLSQLSERSNVLSDLPLSDFFKKLTSSPLMNVEVKNMISTFKDFGLSEKNAHHTTLDIVNLAARAVKEDVLSNHLYTLSLKKYLKVNLPHIIVNNNIEQHNETDLIKKIESFSKKIFTIVNAFKERFLVNKGFESLQTDKKNQEKEVLLDRKSSSKHVINSSNKKTASESSEMMNSKREKIGNTGSNPQNLSKEVSQNESTNRSISVNKNQESIINEINNKNDPNVKQTVSKDYSERSTQNENILQNETKIRDQISRNDYQSEKIIKFLNVTTEKNDFSNLYSSILTLNEQPFVVDFHHQKLDKNSYEKKDMYRVFIETNTQLFGIVFVDTIVSNKKIDIYIYAEEQYAKIFTNHSSTLIKRMKETNYDLRGLFVREKLDQNGILKLKVKQYSNSQNEGGFSGFA